MPKSRLLALCHLFLFTLSVVIVSGCGSKDVDPNAPINEPGYYNGPMKPRGGGGESVDPKGKTP